MRRILIVSPHFPPVNAPDHHRVRLALPYLRSHDWEPTVLAVEPSTIEGAVLEPRLEAGYPDDIRIVRVRGVSPRLTRPLGFGSLWWRAGRALRRAGERLLARETFDLVFFSTTQFHAFTLGPRWLARFGVPYVLDYQDPWLNLHYQRSGERPPGGRLRFMLSQMGARRHEAAVVRHAAAIITVSPAYGPELLSRYPDLDPARLHHLPFGAAAHDIAVALRLPPSPSLVNFEDDRFHVIYAGRCVPGMAPALVLLFRAFQRFRLRHPRRAARFRFHFIGTDYAPPGLAKPAVLPLAREEGVADLVEEHPLRVPYFEALHYLAKADAILVLGSDDPGYNASKLYPCLLTGRPLLCIAHERSPICHTARVHVPASTFSFSTSPPPESEIERMAESWFGGDGHRLPPPRESFDHLSGHTAEAMTRRLVSLFDGASQSPDQP